MVCDVVEKLMKKHQLNKEECMELLSAWQDRDVVETIRDSAIRLRKQYYGDKVFVRGLIEFTNYCKNNCYYCGIRRDNRNAKRYRLTKEQILSCCEKGYGLGFRTFVLQGGEDPYFTDERMVSIIRGIKEKFPDCAVTLSIGEKSCESYRAYREAGADRYLLRHETANKEHYQRLHPSELKSEERKRCLRDLKALGYQVGAGFMVGSPGQTMEHIAEDLVYLQELQPQMIGIGPFIPHHDTKYAGEKAGSVELTLFLLSVLRNLFPSVLLPATTALGTMDPYGREKGFAAGANVVMPNLSPVENRKQYELYDNKLCTDEEAAEGLADLKRRAENTGYRVVVDRGDYVIS